MNRYINLNTPIFKILLSVLTWKLILVVISFLAIMLVPLAQKDKFLGGGFKNFELSPQLFSWANFDGEHYLSISIFGYKHLEQAFFPVYPMLVSFFSKSNLINHPNIRKLENLQKFFQTAVLWPWTFKFIKYLIKLPPNRLFTLWFGFVYFLIHVRAEKRNFWQTIYFALRNYKRLLWKKD